MTTQPPTTDHTAIRVVLAKLGLDGHDRGLRVVTRMLRDQGFEVIYLGLRQTPQTVIAAAIDEDADAIGLSLHNASHLTLAPAMTTAVADAGLHIPVIIGGIIPDHDIPTLQAAGIAAILGPGASATDVATAVRDAVAKQRSA